MKSKGKFLILAVMAALLVGGVSAAFAADHAKHTIDDSLFKASSIVTDPQVGVTAAEWKADVAPSAPFTFYLYFSTTTPGGSGASTYPQGITYAATATTPLGTVIPVYFGGDPTKTSYTFTASTKDATATAQVSIVAPATVGAYTVKLYWTARSGSNPKLADDYGITIGFNVVSNSCTPAATSLSLTPSSSCVIYKTPSTTFTATLTSGSTKLDGRDIDFEISKGGAPATSLGSISTDTDGEATLTLNTSGLAVGGYTITASFQGEECYLAPDPAVATLGVKYDFLGFQPPVLNVQPDGTGVPGLFSGKVIPVKIKIADYDGGSVPDATPFITWSGTIADVTYEDVPTDSVSAADSGNQMRYDPVADQYIYNWDTSKCENGSYTINIDMGEGCGTDRNATVILQKSSGKKK